MHKRHLSPPAFLFSWIFTFILCLTFAPQVKAQDPHFSQFYAAPFSINPAFQGTAPALGKFSFNFRSQWPKVPGEFVTYQTGYEQRFENSGSSLGGWAQLDQAGSAGVQAIQLHLIYAYDLPLSEETAIKAALQLGYGNRNLNHFQLLFGDQLSPFGATGNGTAETGLENINVHYLDVGTGFLLYSENFWAGISGQHLNRPNQSLTEEEDRLPMKISVHAGYKFVNYLPGRSRTKGYSMALNPAIYYSRQGDFQQLDIGANGFIDPVILGLWYRGLPIQSSNNGALVLMGGFRYRGFRFLYSYDTPLGEFATNTGGAHEISTTIELVEIKKRRRRRNRRPSFPSLVN